MDLELERLYLLYQAGSKTDGRKNSYTLQIAQAVGNDLSREEFEAIHSQVRQIETHVDPLAQKSQLQESLWALPDEWRKKRKTDFQPTRTANNEPVQYDDSSPASLQQFLKTKSFDDVKHDSTLRNAWHAAKSDKLEELASTDNLWTTSTDRDELAKELQSLPASIGVDSLGWSLNNLRLANNEGKLDEELAKERKQAENDLPSAPTYQAYDADAMRKRILSNQGSEFAFIDKSLREDVHGGHSLADLAKMERPQKEEAARTWVEGFRKKHEESISQAVVDRRMKGLVASQLPERKESKQHSTQDLLHSAMQAGFSSKEAMNPPTQVHYSPHHSVDSQSIAQQPGQQSSSGEPGGSFNSMDALQLILDGVGVVEPTPFADVANAGISVARAIADPANAGQHIKNAGLSLISTIPYLGDVAKLAKGYGKAGKTVGNAIEGFASSKFAQRGRANANGQSSPGGFLGSLAGLFGGNANGGSPPNFGGNGGSGFGSSSNDPRNPEKAFDAADVGGGFSRLAITVGALIAGFKLLNGWVNKTAERGKTMVENNREMARYSAEMSGAMMQYDHREVLRKIDEAKYLGTSGASLAGSQADLEDSLSEYARPYTRANNDLQTVGNNIANYLSQGLQTLDPIRNVLDKIYFIADGYKKDGGDNNALETLINQDDPIPKQPKVRLPVDQGQVLRNALRKGGLFP